MGCNWGKLVEKNRCKAIGVPWTEEESDAIYKLSIPAEFVRNGCLTTKEYLEEVRSLQEKEKKGEEKPLNHQTKDELKASAKKLKINFTDAVTRPDLMNLINVERSKLPEEQPQPEEEAKVVEEEV